MEGDKENNPSSLPFCKAGVNSHVINEGSFEFSFFLFFSTDKVLKKRVKLPGARTLYPESSTVATPLQV